VIAVGIPFVSSPRASYFEVTPLTDVGKTLRSVGTALLGASAMTTSMGVLLGRWAANRAVRPLSDAARAAKAIAGGRLDTRLEPDDDTGLKELSEAFNDMASALQQRIERDARFASDVSHELRSPLMTLSASIEVMNARRDEMPDRAVAALDLLSADVVRFQGLVEDLLEISRFDAGAIRLHREDQFVAEFVRQAVAISNVPDAPVTVSDKAEELVVRVDKRRMARALANLLDNARVYGAAPITVSVNEPPSEAAQPAHVWIAVEDSGTGVTPEERYLVFERFARGTGARRRGLGEGAGLGLALVDEHVRLHGGRVWVDDRLDGESGARFVIELPAELA
jgi:signal transduction histidine kinase